MYLPKFRKYSFLSEKMYDSIDIENDELHQLDGDNDQEYMMSIGLKDRRGKDIFIGDILVTSNSHPDFDQWDSEEYGYTVVKSTNDLGYSFSNWEIERSDSDSVFSIDFVEVVGNIYENENLI